MVAGASDVRVAIGQGDDQRAQGSRRAAALDAARRRRSTLRHAGDLGRGVGGGAARPCPATSTSTSPPSFGAAVTVLRVAAQAGVVVLGDDENGHSDHPRFVLELVDESAASTLTPALRLAGSATLSVFRRGAMSTPSASGLSVSSGFFLAFMMLGSDA